MELCLVLGLAIACSGFIAYWFDKRPLFSQFVQVGLQSTEATNAIQPIAPEFVKATDALALNISERISEVNPSGYRETEMARFVSLYVCVTENIEHLFRAMSLRFKKSVGPVVDAFGQVESAPNGDDSQWKRAAVRYVEPYNSGEFSRHKISRDVAVPFINGHPLPVDHLQRIRAGEGGFGRFAGFPRLPTEKEQSDAAEKHHGLSPSNNSFLGRDVAFAALLVSGLGCWIGGWFLYDNRYRWRGRLHWCVGLLLVWSGLSGLVFGSLTAIWRW